MKDQWVNFKWQIYLIIIALVFLLVIDFTLRPRHQIFIFPDSTTYLEAAEMLYGSFLPHSMRPILIATINGFPLLFGFSSSSLYGWSIFINTVCWLLVILMLFEILKSFIPEKKAFLATLSYVFCAGSAVLNFHLLAESVFGFFLFLWVYLFWKYLDKGRFVYLSLAISILILSLLIKPAGKILVILLLFIFFRVLFRNAFKKSSVFIYGSLLLIGFQMVWMQKQHGNYTLSYIDSRAVYLYIGARAYSLEKDENKHASEKRVSYFELLTLPDQKRVAFQEIIRQLNVSPLNVVEAYFMNLYDNSIGSSDALMICENTANTSYYSVFYFIFKAMAKVQLLGLTGLGILLGIYYLFKRQKQMTFLFVAALTIVYIIAISGVCSYQGDRFHVVIYPMVILLIVQFIKENTPYLN